MRRTLLAIVGGGLALAVAGCTATGQDPTPSTRRSPSIELIGTPTSLPTLTSAFSSPTVRTMIYGGLTLSRPVTWRLVPPEGVSYGTGGPLGVLTDQPTVAQCATSTERPGFADVSCHSPVTAVGRGGVAIFFSGAWLVFHAPTTHNRVLDGHDATVVPLGVAETRAECPTGTMGSTQMSVFLPNGGAIPAGSGQTVTMTACYAGPDSARTVRDIDAMIDSVRFS